MNRRTCKVLVAVLALFVLLAAGACKPVEQIEAEKQAASGVPNVIINPPAEVEKNTLSVYGSGVANVAPDMATVYFSVSTFNEDAVAAQEENAGTMQAVLDALHINGIADEQIVTSGISFYEEYDYSHDPAELLGYRMENSITVTVYSLPRLGQIIADAIEAGATRVSRVSMSIAKSAVAYANALSAAMEDAAGKARALAEAAGCELGEVPISITERSYSFSPLEFSAEEAVAMAPMADSASNATPISEGQIEVSADIAVVYELLPVQ